MSVSCRLLLIVLLAAGGSLFAAKPNVLIITTDDMSCDSVGVYGCRLKDTTPNMDQLSTRCLRFNYAHTVVGNCMPSRNVMWSGRYPHNNGVEGFYQVQGREVPGDGRSDEGGRLVHRHPPQGLALHALLARMPWDINLDTATRRQQAAREGSAVVSRVVRAGARAAHARRSKPFCLLLNIADPHKPFYAEGKGGAIVDGQARALEGLHAGGSARARLPAGRPEDPPGTRALLLVRPPGRRCRGRDSRRLEGFGRGRSTPSSSSCPITACRCPLPRRSSTTTARARRS